MRAITAVAGYGSCGKCGAEWTGYSTCHCGRYRETFVVGGDDVLTTYSCVVGAADASAHVDPLAGQANTSISVDATAGPVRGRDGLIRLNAAEVEAAVTAHPVDTVETSPQSRHSSCLRPAAIGLAQPFQCISAPPEPKEVKRDVPARLGGIMIDELDEIITLDELPGWMHVSRKTITNRIRQGRDLPPHFRLGRKILFRKSLLMAWIEVQERAQAKSAVEGTDAP